MNKEQEMDSLGKGYYFMDIKKGNCLTWALYYKLKYPTKIKLMIEKGYWVKSLKRGLIPHVYWLDRRDGLFYHFRQRRYHSKWYQFYYYNGQIDRQTFGKLFEKNDLKAGSEQNEFL